MQNYEHSGREQSPDTNTANEEYVYPSFEQHMQKLNANQNNETYPSDLEEPQDMQSLIETSADSTESKSILANNPYSPYLNYETRLKENNEKFGESFAKLNENIYEEYDKASEEALKSSIDLSRYRFILHAYSTDRANNTRHYHFFGDDALRHEFVTPLRIDIRASDGKVANRDEFDPASLEIYENLCAKETETYVKSVSDERKEMQSLIQLNILNNGFANHGVENAKIDTRNNMPSYQATIKNKLAIDGDEAVIPPNPNGEMSLTEYINGVADNYNDMADEARENFEEFQSKFDKVSDTYFHSKNPIKRLFASRKYHKMRAQCNSRLQELETIDLYRAAADDLQQRLERQG